MALLFGGKRSSESGGTSSLLSEKKEYDIVFAVITTSAIGASK